MSFIKTMFMSDLRRAESNGSPQIRLQNIAWPSESMAQLGRVAVGECKRTMFYKILGVKQTSPMSPTGQAICDAGLMYEKFHINKYKDANMHVEEQVAIEYVLPNTENKVVISGKGDELISHQGKLKLIELKSISAYKAPAIMGNEKTLPLPAANNLMQAMLYKYFFSNIDRGQAKGVDEVYLQYVNRSDNSIFFYKVDLNENGYAILTAIDANDKAIYSIDLEKVPSFDDLAQRSEQSTTEEGRLAEVRISISDISKKFDNVYTYARQKAIPDTDYNIIYTPENLELKHKLGLVSTVKYNKMRKGTEAFGDSKCQYCSYLKQCLADSGTKLQ